MFSRRLLQVPQPRHSFVCVFCATRAPPRPQTRFLSATAPRPKSKKNDDAPQESAEEIDNGLSKEEGSQEIANDADTTASKEASAPRLSKRQRQRLMQRLRKEEARAKLDSLSTAELLTRASRPRKIATDAKHSLPESKASSIPSDGPKSLKEALLGAESTPKAKKEKNKGATKSKTKTPSDKSKGFENLPIEVLSPDDLDFQPIEHKIPPVPMLSHGLDRVLFNPGVYRLQDPRSRVYNFDPYLEKIMPVAEFDFDALSEYKTSSKDEDLLAMTRRLNTKFTGSTSSMSGVLQHFHFMLSNFRKLNHNMLSKGFPEPSEKFSKVTRGPSAIFLRWKDGLYAIDADKSYDSPNIMSWLGHSLEKLLTNSRDEFERYRRSSPQEAPDEDESGKCFHYSKLGNFLMRSQLDAHDSRLPGTGIFDLKTRAVVSIRMHHTEYETGSGYQIRYGQGEWESYEREFYDMTRATMLKYSLQVRMGRMDGIFVAYHNIERMFGFQYMSLPEMDNVLHGQTDTCLGDQEFKLSISLLDELLQRATEKFPETSIRLHFEAREATIPYLYVFAEPVTEEQADEIQNAKSEARKEFERNVIGISRDDPEVQAEWQDIQDSVDEKVVDDEMEGKEDDAEADVDTAAQTVQEELNEDEDTAEDSESTVDQEPTEVKHSTKTEPLMGWTLAVRNRVNGAYVERPSNLTPSDNWSIEYHIKEISEDAKWRIYNALQARRKKLLSNEEEQVPYSLHQYREMIKQFSTSGRRWREEQDKIDAEMGQQIFRPLGPGADEILRRETGSNTLEEGSSGSSV